MDETAPNPNGSDMHVSSARSFSLNPQDIVAEHRGKWAKIWLKFAGRCRTPWRDTGNLQTTFSWMPTKRKFIAKDVLQGGLFFKDRTGRGVCDFHPRWFAYLPESSRQEFAELLNWLETSGIFHKTNTETERGQAADWPACGAGPPMGKDAHP